ISVNNFQNVMMGAVYFQMEYIMDDCGRFMRRRLNIDNALPLLIFCKSIAFHKIADFIMRLIDRNFISVSLTPSFHELPI
ncbi:hypothetical protein PENTCL1PPCAC_21569, partial [Pristionchus entomophagus]